MTEEQLRAEATLRVRKALAHIQQAQNELGAACAELSSLNYGVPVWKATSSLYDKVHALWYRVENFRQAGRYKLDSLNVEAMQRRDA